MGKARLQSRHIGRKGWMEITLEAGKSVEVSFLSEPRLEKSPEGGYCLKYGALLFALP